MQDKINHRKFYKQVCYIDQPRKRRKCLQEIFMVFELYEMREELNLWQELVLGSSGHVYDAAPARADLIIFCNRLTALCEAFYLVYSSSADAKKEDAILRLPKKMRNAIQRRNSPVLLDSAAAESPYKTIKVFCKMFSYDYARTELADLADIAVSYSGERKFYRGNILLLYRCLQSLLQIGYWIVENGD